MTTATIIAAFIAMCFAWAWWTEQARRKGAEWDIATFWKPQVKERNTMIDSMSDALGSLRADKNALERRNTQLKEELDRQIKTNRQLEFQLRQKSLS